MLKSITSFFQSFTKPQLKDNFKIDEMEIVREISDGTIERVRWDELLRVTILTTDQGPFYEDVFFVLETNTGGTVVSNEWAEKLKLTEYLAKLPNFNFDAMILAMTCTDNNSFLCWERT